MLIVAKRKDGNLEKKLIELYELACKYLQDTNDAQKLFDLLNLLQEQHQLPSRLFEESEDAENGVIYMLRDHIEHCFSEGGEQVAPVSLFIRYSDNSDLSTLINATGLFKAEVEEFDSKQHQAHIVLHPISHSSQR